MMKRLLILTLALVLLATPIVVLASDISGARYYGIIQISNSGDALTNEVVVASINSTNLINDNYINASANNCVIRSSAGADLPFMPGYTPEGYPWCIWVPSIGAASYLSDILYTADSSGGQIRYFPGTGGMTTPDDDVDFELGDNFTIEQTGWVNTVSDNVDADNLVYKEDAFRTYISATGNITSEIYSGAFNFTGDPDVLSRADHAALSAIDPLTIELWIRTEDNTNAFQGLVNRYGLAGFREWYLSLNNAADELTFFLMDESNDKYIGRKDTAAVINDGEWHYIYASWNGGLTPGDCEIWIDNVQVDDADLEDAGFLGLDDVVIPLQIGTQGEDAGYFIGDIDEVRISDVVRNAPERTAAFNSRRLPNDANTVALYHFDGSGATAVDSSTNGLDLTITGATRTDGLTYSVTASGVSSGNMTVITTIEIR